MSVSGAVSVSGGIDDVATGIGKIEADALIYPLERRLNSVNAVRFCVFGEFGLGWVSENAEVRFHEWLEKFPKIWAHLHYTCISMESPKELSSNQPRVRAFACDLMDLLEILRILYQTDQRLPHPRTLDFHHIRTGRV